MNSDDAAKELIDLANGDKVKYPKKQADRMLDLQKRMGVADFKDPDDKEDSAPEAEPTPQNADNGSTGDKLDNKAEKPKGAKTGG